MDNSSPRLGAGSGSSRHPAPKAMTLSSKPGRAVTSAARFNTMATLMKPRRQSGSLKAALARAWPVSQPGSRGRYSPPAMSASISARRCRSPASVSRYQGSIISAVAWWKEQANFQGSSRPAAVIVSRKSTACSIPIEAPLPTVGFEHAQASPTATTPVTTGAPPAMRLRWRSSIPAIAMTRSSIGCPSSQCATSGKDRTAFSQIAASRRRCSGLSLALVTKVTLHVPLSAGSVRAEMVPRCMSKPPSAGGMSPPAERKCRP